MNTSKGEDGLDPEATRAERRLPKKRVRTAARRIGRHARSLPRWRPMSARPAALADAAVTAADGTEASRYARSSGPSGSRRTRSIGPRTPRRSPGRPQRPACPRGSRLARRRSADQATRRVSPPVNGTRPPCHTCEKIPAKLRVATADRSWGSMRPRRDFEAVAPTGPCRSTRGSRRLGGASSRRRGTPHAAG